MKTKVQVVLYPGCIYFELALALELLHEKFQVEILTPDGAAHRASSGIEIQAQASYATADWRGAAVVLVPGGNPDSVIDNAVLAQYLAAAHGHGCVLAAICAGPSLLARAGILKGRRVAHGYGVEQLNLLKAAFTEVILSEEEWVHDGPFLTAKPYAHIDFAIELAQRLGVIRPESAQWMKNYYRGIPLAQTPWGMKPLRLAGPRVTVRTLAMEDVPALAQVLHDPTGWYGSQWGRNTVPVIEAMLRTDLTAFSRGLGHPLVYRVGDDMAGFTRLMRLEPPQRTLEIGGTWVVPKWRRTFVNTEVKWLLLKYAFEEMNAIRVEFRIDVRNVESQRAIERVGATFEGVLRHRQIYPDGLVSDGRLYSVVQPEWERVGAKLDEMVNGTEGLSLS